ncbi:unnamed protein product, partial [Symbiodinium natans]
YDTWNAARLLGRVTGWADALHVIQARCPEAAVRCLRSAGHEPSRHLGSPQSPPTPQQPYLMCHAERRKQPSCCAPRRAAGHVADRSLHRWTGMLAGFGRRALAYGLLELPLAGADEYNSWMAPSHLLAGICWRMLVTPKRCPPPISPSRHRRATGSARGLWLAGECHTARRLGVYVPAWGLHGAVCFDFAVSSGLRSFVFAASANDGSAVAYEGRKRSHFVIAAQCRVHCLQSYRWWLRPAVVCGTNRVAAVVVVTGEYRMVLCYRRVSRRAGRVGLP